MANRLFYNTVLSQIFSPCGKYLLAANTYGDVAVYDLQKVLDAGDKVRPATQAEYIFTVKADVQICSMVSADKFLAIGTVGEIIGYDWKSIISTHSPKVAWTIQIPTPKDALDKPDVNAMVLDSSSNYIFAGCGDNKIHIFSLEDGKHVKTLGGHEDYIHCLNKLETLLVSAGEDGVVNLWDTRQKNITNSLHPHLNDQLMRPELGKWIGTAALNDDWLLCGGGPRLSLWHLRTLNMSTVFSLDDNGMHVSLFYDDRIMAGGASPFFYQLNYNGETRAQVPCSSTTIYSAVLQETPYKVLSIAGSSPEIDLCTNLNYRDQVLLFSCDGQKKNIIDYPVSY